MHAVPADHIHILEARLRQRRHVRQRGETLCRTDRQRAQTSAQHMRHAALRDTKTHLRLSAHQIGERCGHPFVRDIDHLDSGVIQKHFCDDMRRGTVARIGIVHLPRLRPRQLHELSQCFRRHRGMHDHHPGQTAHQGDRCEVALKIKRQLRIQMRERDKRGGREQPGVTISRRLRHGFAGDDATGGGPLIDYQLLSPYLGEFLADHAREQIRRRPEYQTHRPHRIILCLCRRCNGHQCQQDHTAQ